MGGKWKPYILYELTQGPKRPSELQRSVPEASTRVINQHPFRPAMKTSMAAFFDSFGFKVN